MKCAPQGAYSAPYPATLNGVFDARLMEMTTAHVERWETVVICKEGYLLTVHCGSEVNPPGNSTEKVAIRELT